MLKNFWRKQERGKLPHRREHNLGEIADERRLVVVVQFSSVLFSLFP